MDQKTLLLIEDDRLVLATLAKGLEEAGYNVKKAESGEQAMTLLKDGLKPDLALVDNYLPDTNGIDIAKVLSCEHNVPFMMFSAYSEEELVSQAIELGALGYLVKPLNIPQIIPSIESALQLSENISVLKKNEFNLNKALNADRNTSAAVGLIMERHRLNRQSAFEILRKMARSNQKSISETAEEILVSSETLNAVANH
jgi:response regulator NasT